MPPTLSFLYAKLPLLKNFKPTGKSSFFLCCSSKFFHDILSFCFPFNILYQSTRPRTAKRRVQILLGEKRLELEQSLKDGLDSGSLSHVQVPMVTLCLPLLRRVFHSSGFVTLRWIHPCYIPTPVRSLYLLY